MSGESASELSSPIGIPDKLELAERLRGYEPEEPNPDQGAGRVISTGVAELYAEIEDEMLVQAAVDDGASSAASSRGLALGAARAAARSRPHARRDDAGDRRIPAKVHRGSIWSSPRRWPAAPRSRSTTRGSRPPAVRSRPRCNGACCRRSCRRSTGWEIATMYRAARGAEEVEVGGDFYDFIQTPDGWVVLLGDVTGKGVEAASMTSLVRHGARFLGKHEQSPGKILARLNEELREQPGMWLCSALCVRLHRDRVVISSAGHPAPFIVRADGRIREIGVTGPILGAWSGGASVERSVPIAPDETLFLFTDGVVDTRGESERFGTDRLKRLLSEHGGLAPEALLVEVEGALDNFQRQAQSDDTAAVALRPCPSGVAVAFASPTVRERRAYPSREREHWQRVKRARLRDRY